MAAHAHDITRLTEPAVAPHASCPRCGGPILRELFAAECADCGPAVVERFYCFDCTWEVAA